MALDDEPIPSKQVLSYLNGLPVQPANWDLGPEGWRQAFREESLAASGSLEGVKSVEDLSINGVTARMYQPAEDVRNILIWIHGGGWMIGDPDCYDALARALANRANCNVLSVDYRLAPENPYPAALEDCWKVMEWAAQNYEGVAVGGDSSGGNLSAVIALRARDSDMRLALQLLVYPVLDYRVDSDSYNTFKERYENFADIHGFGAEYQEGMRWIWNAYIPEVATRIEPEASPLRAMTLKGVAPALIITVEHDILRCEAEEYAQRMLADGVEVQLLNYDKQIHRFFHMLGVFDDAQDAVTRCAEALKKAFLRD